MSESGNGPRDPYDPYDPQRSDRPDQPQQPQQPDEGTPQWGSAPPPPPAPSSEESGGWSGGQLSSGEYAPQQPGYGQQQPAYGQQPYGAPAGSPPPNYLVPAILSTVLCCLPLGIVSIVFAAQVNGKHASGDVEGARNSSRKAKSFAIWSVVAGVVVLVLYALGAVALMGTSTSP